MPSGITSGNPSRRLMLSAHPCCCFFLRPHQWRTLRLSPRRPHPLVLSHKLEYLFSHSSLMVVFGFSFLSLARCYKPASPSAFFGPWSRFLLLFLRRHGCPCHPRVVPSSRAATGGVSEFTPLLSSPTGQCWRSRAFPLGMWVHGFLEVPGVMFFDIPRSPLKALSWP